MSQGIHTSPFARAAALVAAFLVAFAVLVLPASPAHAHDELLGSDPAADSTVDDLPAQISFTFSGAIATDEGASEVSVTDAAGTEFADGTPTAQDNVLTQPLAGAASGELTVLWKTVSSDGHPISGEFAFTVSGGAAPTDPEPTATATELPDDMTVDPGATLLANLLPVLVGAAIVGAAIVAIVLAVRRRRPPSPPSGPGSEPPTAH
jgi:methionine-rich copper-binding protein CopC